MGYQAALDQGELLAPAKSVDEMHQIILNSTVDGILAALFAILIVIVIADAARVWIKALRSPEPLPSTEAPYERSKIVAPSGLIVTREERELMAQASADKG